MNYSRIYEAFIADRRRIEPELKRSGVYTERHHIVPRSLGGADESENLIQLSVEDHIHAHILLARIHGGRQWAAVLFMTKKTVGRTRSLSRTPTKEEIRAAGFAKRMFAAHCRGENHPHYGKKTPESVRLKMSKAHAERGAKGLMWAQQNPNLISGDNHWTKKPEKAEALERAKPIFVANLKKATVVNRGAGNAMHRPEVKKKIGENTRRGHAEGVGIGSLESRAANLAAHNTPEYLAGARERFTGERNPNFGRPGGQNYNSRQVLCVETNTVFNSVKEAVEFCGGDVTKAARTGRKAGGYTWKRLTAHATDGRVLKGASGQSNAE